MHMEFTREETHLSDHVNGWFTRLINPHERDVFPYRSGKVPVLGKDTTVLVPLP